jgi:3-oxoacyl-[acyl-carrier-protein] synthase II
MSSTYLRAFDERHDGTLLGEGAGFILLENAKDKKAYAYLIGCGSANDGAGLTAPDHYGRGASLAIERSLKQAGISASDIGLINAHGSGTPINDEIELHSLQTVFGQKNSPLIFATKGALGHTLGATGALETIALILALREKIVPPIVGLEKLYPFNYPLAVGSAKKHQAHYGLNITLGFGGFDTSLIFEAV